MLLARFRIAVVAIALFGATACGAALGSLGSADQAKKDLTPSTDGGGGPRAERTAAEESQAERKKCLVDGVAGASVAADCLAEQGSAIGSWYWITAAGDVLTESPADGSGGSWYWVTSSGSIALSGAPGTGRGWYWVSAKGVVTTAPPSTGGDGGGWFELASPSQVSTVPKPGSSWITTPGGSSAGAPGVGEGWYWSPSGDVANGPVWGGSNSAPVVPGAPTPQPVANPSVPSGRPVEGHGCEGAQAPIVETVSDGVMTALADSGGDQSDIGCPIRLHWTAAGHTRDQPGVGFSFAGAIDLLTDPAKQLLVEVDVAADGIRPPALTAIRGSMTGVSFTGAATVGAAPKSVCKPPGVALDARIQYGTVPRHLTIVICDPSLAADLLS